MAASDHPRPTADYERRTRLTTLAELPEALGDAVRARAEGLLLPLPPDSPGLTTTSRRLHRPGLLSRVMGSADPDTEHLTAVVLGPRDVLVATHGEQRGTAVLHTRLEDLELDALAARLGPNGAAMLADGMSLTGFPVSGEGGSSRGSFFVGLGEPDGAAARRLVADAVRRAKAS